MGGKNVKSIGMVIATAVFGILLLIASSVLVAEIMDWVEECFKVWHEDVCDPVGGFFGASVFGILASFIQIVLAVVVLAKRGMVTKWTMFGWHLGICVVALIGFGAAAHYNNSDYVKLYKKVDDNFKSKLFFFLGASGLYWIGCLIVSVAALILIKAK